MSESSTDRTKQQSWRCAREARTESERLMRDKAFTYPNGFMAKGAHIRRISTTTARNRRSGGEARLVAESRPMQDKAWCLSKWLSGTRRAYPPHN